MSDSDSDVPALWNYSVPTAAPAAKPLPEDDIVFVEDQPSPSCGAVTRTGNGRINRKRNAKEIELEKFLAADSDDDDADDDVKDVTESTKGKGRGKGKKEKDFLEELGLSTTVAKPAKRAAVKPAGATRPTAAVAKFEDIFDLGDDPEEEPTPPPKKAGPAPVSTPEEDNEVQIEEEPLVVQIKFFEGRVIKKIKIKPGQTFQKAIHYANTCEEGLEMSAAKGGKAVFLVFDGDPIRVTDTPNGLGLETDDTVEAHC